MRTLEEVRSWEGRDVYDKSGEKVGTIDAVYLDEATGRPDWLAINTGLFGMKTNFAPAHDAVAERDDAVRIPYDKDRVKDAPGVDPDGRLSTEEERELFAYYGADYDAEPVERESRFERGGDDAMTRSEEELHVGTERGEAGRARLRKHVVTENVTKSVPVEREEIHVEREPITDENRDQALSGEPISESEHEVVAYEEQPVVEKRAVPKERVRLAKDSHTDEERVSEDVRKERIEAEGDAR